VPHTRVGMITMDRLDHGIRAETGTPSLSIDSLIRAHPGRRVVTTRLRASTGTGT
jgi:hypothetical protein